MPGRKLFKKTNRDKGKGTKTDEIWAKGEADSRGLELGWKLPAAVRA